MASVMGDGGGETELQVGSQRGRETCKAGGSLYVEGGRQAGCLQGFWWGLGR